MSFFKINIKICNLPYKNVRLNNAICSQKKNLLRKKTVCSYLTAIHS
jgi:hypothetical protein